MKLENLNKNLNLYKDAILEKCKEAECKTAEDIMDTLCFSFSDIIVDFIEDNKDEECFKNEINSYKYNGNREKYIENVLCIWQNELPFAYKEPKVFFKTIWRSIMVDDFEVFMMRK